MPELAEVAARVRSKNAGPFWVTIDIFCGAPEAFERVRQGLDTARVARAFDVPEQIVRRFDIPGLNVVKFSIPRPNVQGTVRDRDMHGAAWAAILAEMEIG